jgi:hypothetical protein
MLMAMFGWSSLSVAQRYTEAADRRRLARMGMATLLPVPRRGTNEA